MIVWNFFCKGFAYLNPDDLQNLVKGKGSWPASLHLYQAGPIILSKKQIKKLQKSRYSRDGPYELLWHKIFTN
jgi:hypothetical protein